MDRMPFSFDRLSGAVKWLLAANVAFYIGQQFFPGQLEYALGLVPSRVIGSLRIWQPLTYLFLHGSFFHLLINLFTLWMFGRELEAAWGTKEFLKYYFACGIGAGIINTLVDPFSTLPVIGASGAIYGLLVAFAMVYPDSLIYLYGIIPLRARSFVVLLGVIEFFSSFHASATPVARFAHLGGMAVGYAYLKSFEFRGFMDRAFHRVLDLFVVRRSRPSFTVHRPEESDLVQEVDRILEKVLAQGAESLTEREKEVMRRYSSMKR
jgi:membrane associated rhomboid family serine protease